ncbi:MAG: sigma-70 family RNA polymerase sigma factor [Mycobacterium sp.]|uniref:sigma-70 family RNA polymerase sigma factor n=1 Tax=Mycobacterium sp. TaxID=1785 RepID=UPI003F982FDD
MTNLAVGTSTDGGSDESAEPEAAPLVREAETVLHDAREPGIDAWIASTAKHRSDRVSRAGCQIQPAQQHQQFMRMIDRTYRKLLVHYASGFTRGDHERAEDLFQEAMMRAWRNAEWLEANPDLVRPWLFTVIRRLAIDNYRALRSRPQELGNTPLERLVTEDPTDRALTGQVVRRALERLSPDHRQVLVYRYFLDRSVEDTADKLDIAIGTVKSRSSYALRALRQSLGAREAAPAA